MARFDQEIEARWPDPDGTPGWDEIRLVCGHTDYAPSDVKVRLWHCGQCFLDHEAHLRRMAEINRKEATRLRAAAELGDQVFEATWPEENPI